MASDHRFRFGVQLARASSADDWARQARRAEELGYSTLLVPDHFGEQLAPVPAMLAAAQATSTLRVGPLVLDNDYRHPLVLAKELATLDVLSGGRLEVGLGAGWMRTDYQQSGIPYDRPGVRIERMEEGLAIIKGLLGSADPFSFKGQHYEVNDAVGTPRPVQSPRPPILLGGGGRRVLSIAAAEADIVGVTAKLTAGEIDQSVAADTTAEATAAKVEWVRQAAGDRFDDLELQIQVVATQIVDDREAFAGEMAALFGLTTEQLLEVPQALFGSAAEIADQLKERRDRYGFSYIVTNDQGFEALAPVIDELAGT